MSNKLTKQSYFIMRLRSSGYYVDKIKPRYKDTDRRNWTILINPKEEAVFCTCYSNNGESYGSDDNFFEIHDGGQFIPGRLSIVTSSLETFITNLNNYGIMPLNDR